MEKQAASCSQGYTIITTIEHKNTRGTISTVVGMVVCARNPSSWETEQDDLEFEVILSFIVRLRPALAMRPFI